jgi:glycolate oxidase iron-sulfur subunit
VLPIVRTDLPEAFRATPTGRRADEILRSCVHCGFCNATCPTYLLLGDELDGPRGRIYLIKDMLETGAADAVTRTHLDRCLTCRSCETTCPSGVAYGELLEIGRELIETTTARPLAERGVRRWLRHVVPRARRFRRWVRVGRAFRWLLPARLREHVPRPGRAPRIRRRNTPAREALQRVLVLEGCVQRAVTPEVNGALRQLLERHGIEAITVRREACCGSLALHLGHGEEARATIVRNLDALAPYLDGLDAIVSTASGCGVTVKDYGRLLADMPAHAELAARVAALTVDVAEYLKSLDAEWSRGQDFERVAWHAPCTLQHGQKVRGAVETLLSGAGYDLVPVRDPHLCCGSAGTYSILEPELSATLRDRKLDALCEHAPDAIATANVGCQLHLRAAADVPVLHWLQLLR